MLLDELVDRLNAVRTFHTTVIGRGTAIGMVSNANRTPDGKLDIPDSHAEQVIAKYAETEVRLSQEQAEWDAGAPERERQRQEAEQRWQEQQAEAVRYRDVFETLTSEGFTPSEVRRAVQEVVEDGGRRDDMDAVRAETQLQHDQDMAEFKARQEATQQAAEAHAKALQEMLAEQERMRLEAEAFVRNANAEVEEAERELQERIRTANIQAATDRASWVKRQEEAKQRQQAEYQARIDALQAKVDAIDYGQYVTLTALAHLLNEDVSFAYSQVQKYGFNIQYIPNPAAVDPEPGTVYDPELSVITLEESDRIIEAIGQESDAQKRRQAEQAAIDAKAAQERLDHQKMLESLRQEQDRVKSLTPAQRRQEAISHIEEHISDAKVRDFVLDVFQENEVAAAPSSFQGDG